MSKKAGVDKETRRAALLLSGLITTPEDDLEDYRKKRLGRGSTVPLDHLARARAVLVAVADVLHSDRDEDIARLEELHRTATKGKPAPPKKDAADDEAREPDTDTTLERGSPTEETRQVGDEERSPPDDNDDPHDDPVPRPPRVGEDAPAEALPRALAPLAPLAPKDSPSPWANPTAALIASRPAPPTATARESPSEPAVAPRDVAPPPRVAPPPEPPLDDELQTERPPSSKPPPEPGTHEREPLPRAGETAAPPASTTAEAGLDLPPSPALPFVGAQRDGSHATPPGRDWALPFKSSAAPPPSEPVDEREIPAAAPRFPRAEPDDDDEPTMASINLKPAERSPIDAESRVDGSSADEAEASAADLAHMTLPGSALTLTDYAALCAICGAFPAHLSDTYLRFGLTDHTERYALDEAWQSRFGELREAHALWKSLFTQFRAWLTQYGRL